MENVLVCYPCMSCFHGHEKIFSFASLPIILQNYWLGIPQSGINLTSTDELAMMSAQILLINSDGSNHD